MYKQELKETSQLEKCVMCMVLNSWQGDKFEVCLQENNVLITAINHHELGNTHERLAWKYVLC